MRHPTEGVLRRLLDDPAGVADADRRHVTECGQCLDAVAAARDDAARVDAALATAVDVDVDGAWRRFTATAPAAGRAPSTHPLGARLRSFLHRPAAAGLAVAVVLTGAGTAAANDWLPIFRTETVAPVSISAEDLIALPDLSSYGELEMSSGPDVHEVADAATAARETGLDVPKVTDLPRGISGEPGYRVGRQVSATFTFSTARATRAAAEAGEALPTPPPGLDGAQVRLVAGPGVAQVWSSDAGAPAGLVVVRAVAPTAYSTGIPFETARDYLLSLPGLPDDVAAQLRAFDAEGGTLPLPIPENRVRTTPAEVDGVPATVLTTRDRTLAGVVWADDGVLTAVAGSLDTDEVLSIARDLE